MTALFYSPWDEGGTSASAIQNLNWILGAAVGLTLLAKVAGRGKRGAASKERLERSTQARTESREVAARWSETAIGRSLFQPASVLCFLASALLLLGWGMALNAHAVFDADYLVFLPMTSAVPGAPGAVDSYLSVALMWRVTALLGCVMVMADLANDPKWLLRIWWGIALAGGSIALLGLLQKATGAELPLWQTLEAGEHPLASFFGPFYYHGNAGAYLNLALPAVLGLAYRYVTGPRNPWARALFLVLSVLMIVAVISDTSRMGQAIAVLTVTALLILALSGGRVLRRVRHLEWKTAMIAILAGGFALWAIVQTSHLDRSLGRWESFQTTWKRDARWTVDQIALDSLPKAGALGFGPGTFSAVFPRLLEGADDRAQGAWLFLHNDYLQTMLEWGWVGGLLWGGISFGGMLVALLSLAHKERVARWLPRQRTFVPLALTALAGVALHATVDFPLQISSIQLYAAIYLGVCWGAAAAQPQLMVKR